MSYEDKWVELRQFTKAEDVLNIGSWKGQVLVRDPNIKGPENSLSFTRVTLTCLETIKEVNLIDI